MKNKKLKKYLKSKKFQEDCYEFNNKFVDLLNDYSNDMSKKKFIQFSEITLPTVLIQNISNFFESCLNHDEETVDWFVHSIKKTIMNDCKIEETPKDCTMIDDIGAVA